MNFNDNKPIYLQIYDTICEKILSKEYVACERIPSVREYAANIGVNPNTLMRTYERLTQDGIIYNKRGIGYFVSDDAINIIKNRLKEDFIQNEVPQIKKKMELLGINPTIFINS